MVVTGTEINEVLNWLQEPADVPLDNLNYNYYVDDILQAGFHYDAENEGDLDTVPLHQPP
jgi:hypothetical protein